MSNASLACRQIDPEMMSFDKERNLLIVSGAVSGTLGVYKVEGLPTCGGTCGPCSSSATPEIASAAEDSAHSLNFTVTLPYIRNEFDAPKLDKYKAAMASAAGAPVGNVDTLSIKQNSRRAAHGGPSIDILTKVQLAVAPWCLAASLRCCACCERLPG